MGIRLVSDTTTAVRARREHARTGIRCHMKGPAAIVVSRLKGATEAMAARFRREHARIQSHQGWRLDGKGGAACAHRHEVSVSVGEDEDVAETPRDGQ